MDYVDTNEYANDELNNLLDVIEGQTLRFGDMHVGSGWTHPDERTCTNCTRLNECWDPVSSALGTPEAFRFRSGWDADRFKHHMKGVIGQVCNTFQHSNSSINARHERAERRRRAENGEGNEWDTEVN